MKVSRLLVLSSFLFLTVFGLTFSANAALVDNDDGTITDTDTNLMWIQDANYAFTSGYDADGKMYRLDAMAWASTLGYAGHNDWRIPSALNSDGSGPCLVFNCTDSEMGHLYYTELGNVAWGPPTNTGPFVNLQIDDYWYDTEYNAQYAVRFDFAMGDQNLSSKNMYEYYALAVRDISIVPEPISSVLFIIGGATLGFRRFRKRIN